MTLSSDVQTHQQYLCWTHLRVSQQPQEAASSICTLHSSLTMQMGRINRELMFGVARKHLTLRASGGSNTPSSYTQTHRSC